MPRRCVLGDRDAAAMLRTRGLGVVEGATPAAALAAIRDEPFHFFGAYAAFLSEDAPVLSDDVPPRVAALRAVTAADVDDWIVELRDRHNISGAFEAAFRAAVPAVKARAFDGVLAPFADTIRRGGGTVSIAFDAGDSDDAPTVEVRAAIDVYAGEELERATVESCDERVALGALGAFDRDDHLTVATGCRDEVSLRFDRATYVLTEPTAAERAAGLDPRALAPGAHRALAVAAIAAHGDRAAVAVGEALDAAENEWNSSGLYELYLGYRRVAIAWRELLRAPPSNLVAPALLAYFCGVDIRIVASPRLRRWKLGRNRRASQVRVPGWRRGRGTS